jgi:uncharacterized membrane protein
MAPDHALETGSPSWWVWFADLALVASAAVVSLGVWWFTGGEPTIPRILLGLPFVLLFPGYALTGAMFPRNRHSDYEAGKWTPESVRPVERLVLSVGLSITVVPLLLLFLNFTPWGITAESTMGTIGLFVVGSTLIATARQAQLPLSDRTHIPFGALRQIATRKDSGSKLAHMVIVALLVLSIGVAGGALTTVERGDAVTEFYLLSEDDATGELVAADYPEQIGPETNETIHVGVTNQEQGPREYTVVVELHRIGSVDGNRSVMSRSELSRYRLRLQSGESNVTEHPLSADLPADSDTLRLTFLLYPGEIGDSPAIPAADRQTHIWVEIAPDDGGTA